MWLLIKFKLMYILFFLQLFLAGISNPDVTLQIANCPANNSTNRSIVEDFLSKPYWSQERTETNTEHLTISQITLLSDTNDSTACTSLNTTYQEALDEKNGLGEQAYNFTYYKAGSFYFVVITIRQSDIPNYVTSGINYIHIYDQSQDLVEAYAF
ncbi:MAG: hypothetical protein ABJ387_07290 [Balneola sp.]